MYPLISCGDRSHGRKGGEKKVDFFPAMRDRSHSRSKHVGERGAFHRAFSCRTAKSSGGFRCLLMQMWEVTPYCFTFCPPMLR